MLRPRMSPRAALWILWSGAVLMVPVPILLFGPGRVPPLRLLELGGASLVFLLLESSRGVVGALAALLLGQAAIYGAVLWLAAWLAARALGRLPSRAVGWVTWGALAAGLALSATFEVYTTPFAADSARATLLGVFR